MFLLQASLFDSDVLLKKKSDRSQLYELYCASSERKINLTKLVSKNAIIGWRKRNHFCKPDTIKINKRNNDERKYSREFFKRCCIRHQIRYSQVGKLKQRVSR